MSRCVRTTLSIEDGLLEEAKRQAFHRKVTIGEVVNEALRFGLLVSEKTPDADEVERPLGTFRGDGLQAGVDLYNSSSLRDHMEGFSRYPGLRWMSPLD